MAIVLTSSISGRPARADDEIDFGRDVQPLLRAHCFECHGPKQQKNGFRLDRRRDALRGGTVNVIAPGTSAASQLYLKLVGDQYGPQMPPTGPLEPEQINIIKAWIDQGARWPDELAGEMPSTPPDPKAARMMEALRGGDQQAFRKMLGDEPGVARLKGPGGATPLMYAALYGDADSVELVLERGVDPNVRNEAGATALMWAVDDPEKTRLLLQSGADVNARSEDGRTPLSIAAGRYGSSAVVELMLDHGASPAVKNPSYKGAMTPLREAADVGDEATLRLLIARGLAVKDGASLALVSALNANDAGCVDLLINSADPNTMGMALIFAAPPFGDAQVLARAPLIRRLVERGADVNARDGAGRSVLMLVACLDTLPLDTVRTLIEHGAETNTKSKSGQTALDFARQRGQTPVVDLLNKAGAEEGEPPAGQAIAPLPAPSVRAALERSIPLLQRADANFLQKTGCVSCHNNSLTAMTIAAARKQGLAVDHEIARKQLKSIASYIDGWRERVLQGLGIPGDSDTISYLLLGMAAENYSPDPATDALARYLKSRQSRDGRWRVAAHRPPLESSEIEVTAASIRALKVYAPGAQRSAYEKAVERAGNWLKQAQPRTTEDRAFHLLGLGWAGGNQEFIEKAAHDLLAEQRSDGGWAQLPSLASDAYATGQALRALNEAGALEPTDPAYRRGVQFLISTQLEDGSWYVRSRSIAFQPYFESGFPHGHNQWISAAATNWAAMALVAAVR
jgi:ankyrin repeat protein